jgi:serine protease Do
MLTMGNDWRRPRAGLSARCLTLCAALCLAAGSAAAVEPASEAAARAADPSPPRNIADLKTLEKTVQKVVAAVAPSVVYVPGGSGVVLSSDGYVLTVAHVARRAGRELVLVFPDGRRVRAVTLGNDYGVDAGLVKIVDEGPWPHAEWGRSDNLQSGQWCLTLGYPVSFEHGKTPAVRIARVLHYGKNEIITDGTIMGGDSGAPLFDLDGKVIGIGTKCIDLLVYNIHVPIDRYRDDWEKLVQGKDFNSLAPKRAFLGVLPAERNDEPRVAQVIAGSAAEKSGVRPGDLVLKFGGREIHKFSELPPLVRRHKPGDQVEIELRRGGETLKLQATLGQRDPGAEQ